MYISFVLPILVFAVGVYLLFRLDFFFILHPIRTSRSLASSLKNRDSRRAFSLALAGTLGVGNIFGVAAGIIYGGAGSVFWLAVSSVFAMVIKYSECILSAELAEGNRGGLHFVLLKCFPKGGKALSLLYAALCIGLALFMGAAMQSASAVNVAFEIGGGGRFALSVLFTAAIIFGVFRGAGKVDSITEKLIPLSMIVYILLTLTVVLLNSDRLLTVAAQVVSEAFSPRSALGGGFAFINSRALSEGFARGILSNEAGCGTSSLAHARSRDRTPHEAGLAGIAEVFFDTSILCMLTAFAILCAVPAPQAFSSPMALISYAVTGTLGEWAGVPLTLSVFVFAYSTVICWYSYGCECTEYLLGKRGDRVFLTLFLVFVLFGAYIPSRSLVSITDAVMLFLCLLTMSAIISCRNRTADLSRRG